jgi:hypothetical protein
VIGYTGLGQVHGSPARNGSARFRESDGMIVILLVGSGDEVIMRWSWGVAGGWLVNVEKRERLGTCIACLCEGRAGLEKWRLKCM